MSSAGCAGLHRCHRSTSGRRPLAARRLRPGTPARCCHVSCDPRTSGRAGGPHTDGGAAARAGHVRGDPQRDHHDQRDPAVDGVVAHHRAVGAVGVHRLHADHGRRHPGHRLVPPAGHHPPGLRHRHGRLPRRHHPVSRRADLRGAAAGPDRAGRGHGRDDAPADDHVDDRGARAGPRPGHGQRHPGDLGGAGARARRVRADPSGRVLAAAVRGRPADRGSGDRVRAAQGGEHRRPAGELHRLAQRRRGGARLRRTGVRPEPLRRQ